ncbi:DUF6591 domain-containing protein [Lacrimispora sp. 38-1]|uniref:DUF6591 domain-containing protein n=1 Tax=Lacrimispora sp. 38-1 TaxID=3125778 RepID=UPI003CE89457
MKKVVLVVLLCGCLVGCGKKVETKVVNSIVEETTESTELKEAETTIKESETQVTSREDTNFENTCWGDDIATVKKYETDISWTSEDDTALKGMSKFLNKDVVVEFDFENGKLYQVVMLPDIDYADKKDLYMEDFNSIKDSLKEEYGEPSTDNPDKYWTKTDNKQAEYGVIWTHDNMYIGAGSMSWDNEQWLCVTYADTAYIDGLKTKEQPTGISPEFKAAMDSYEEFFDEYIAFMKKYKESTDQASMITDYTNYMKKYTELMGKMNELNNDQLSTEEAAYYVEVSARITQKLAAATQ